MGFGHKGSPVRCRSVCASNGKKLLASISINRKQFPRDVSHVRRLTANLDASISAGCLSGRPLRVVRRAMGCRQPKVQQTSANGEAAMTTVAVVTAGSGDTYRIERVYLDRDQAYGFAQDCNGIAPVEPVQVEEWQHGARRRPTTGRTGGGPSGGRGCRSASVAVSCGTPRRRTARRLRHPPGKGGPGTQCRSQGSAIANSPGCPRSRWRACRTEKVAETSGRRLPRSEPTWRESKEVISALCGSGWKQTGVVTRHCRPSCVMIGPWIDTPWNGSATTS